jgi:hypothetical protein
LREENRLLCEQLGGRRLRFTNNQRRTQRPQSRFPISDDASGTLHYLVEFARKDRTRSSSAIRTAVDVLPIAFTFERGTPVCGMANASGGEGAVMRTFSISGAAGRAGLPSPVDRSLFCSPRHVTRQFGGLRRTILRNWSRIRSRLQTEVLCSSAEIGLDGRGGQIRTGDPLRPRQVRYQAALRPDFVDGLTSQS